MLLKTKFNGVTFYIKDLVTEQVTQYFARDQWLRYIAYATDHQSGLQSIFASLLTCKDYWDALGVEGKKVFIPRGTKSQYERPKLIKLPSGRVCAKAYIRKMDCKHEERETTLNPEFYLVAPNQELLKQLVYRRIYSMTRTPLCPVLHPLVAEWQEWIWTLFQVKEWLKPLTTLVGTLEGVAVSWNELELRNEMEMRIKMRDPLITRYFEEGLHAIRN
jgi:hypothetical protein